MVHAAVEDLHVRGVDQVDGRLGPGIPVEPGGGVDLQGGADDQDDVRRGDQLHGPLDLRDGFAEEDDVRAVLGAVGRLVAQVHLVVANVDDVFLGEPVVVVAGVLGADLGGLAVQVHDVGGAGALVEVVHVLRDHVDGVALLELRDEPVRLVGAGVAQLRALHVVEVQHEPGVAGPPFRGSDHHRVVVVPETAVVAVGPQAALGAHAGAGQHCDALFHSPVILK